MFGSWITRPQDRARLKSNVLCRELLLFAEWLESRGYPPRTLRRYLFAAEAFGRWIEQKGWAMDEVDESRLQRVFAGHRRQRCRGREHGRVPDAVSGVRKFVENVRLLACRLVSRPHGRFAARSMADDADR